MAPDPTRTHPIDPEAQQAEDAQYYRRVLHDIIDMATDLARHVHTQAKARPATATPEQQDPSIAFDRIARAIRRTIALARHIAEARPSEPRPDAKPRANAREKLIRDVEDAIHRRRKETDADALYAELNERLDDPELELDLQGRPIEDIVEEICRDLGVAVQGRSWVWRRRTLADIAALRARAATPPPPTSPPPASPQPASPPAPPGTYPRAVPRPVPS